MPDAAQAEIARLKRLIAERDVQLATQRALARQLRVKIASIEAGQREEARDRLWTDYDRWEPI